jgi:DNA-binding transcriptional MocR family regulator
MPLDTHQTGHILPHVDTKYLRVAAAVRQRIQAGEWKPGKLIPNEGDLAREMGVSSGTTRKALDALEADGLLERKQGRGTFVRELVPWGDVIKGHAGAALAHIGRLLPLADSARLALVDADGEPIVRDGEMVVYTPTDLAHLEAGIHELRAWLELRAIAVTQEGRP